MNNPAIIIEDGIPTPVGNRHADSKLGILRSTIASMKPGQSFVYPATKSVYKAADDLNVKIRMRKLNGGGYRVWRVK